MISISFYFYYITPFFINCSLSGKHLLHRPAALHMPDIYTSFVECSFDYLIRSVCFYIETRSATVVFHDMDRPMASLILDKKLGELGSKLSSRQVEMVLSQEAHKWLLQRGFIPEYGAREMDRVIAAHLKPLLMREILFGTLKAGGKVRVQVENGALKLQPATE